MPTKRKTTPSSPSSPARATRSASKRLKREPEETPSTTVPQTVDGDLGTEQIEGEDQNVEDLKSASRRSSRERKTQNVLKVEGEEKSVSSRSNKTRAGSEANGRKNNGEVESKTASSDAVRVKPEAKDDDVPESRFVGEPIDRDKAKLKWPHRYGGKDRRAAGSKNLKEKDDSDEIILAKRHYSQAEVDGKILFKLYDDAHVQAGEGEDCFICKIVEMFEAVDGAFYFTAQWYYRAKDTVIKDHASFIDKKRVFFSEVRDDNPLDCLVEKLNIARIDLKNKGSIPDCDYYCDMMYLLPYSTFVKFPPSAESWITASEESSTISSEVNMGEGKNELKADPDEVCQVKGRQNNEVTLLDLYSGCGAMSTGLCLGASLSNLNLVTRWTVDINKYACQSLWLNHPQTEVRHETAEDFLTLLKEWEMLCTSFGLVKGDNPHPFQFDADEDDEEDDDASDDDEDIDNEEIFEVEKILSVCYGDPKEKGERGLWFKVKWKGYGEEYDSWEPLEGLRNCGKTIKEFVQDGYRRKILPLPGDVDVICGGPPCQGISGFNRFRDKNNPLRDEKNKQLIVFMEIVEYLKPRYMLMENVVDLVKFAGGFLGRYALGRLVGMDYQARLGMLAAGAYGLPQFRMRVFVWGARPAEKLPQYPLPTHDVVVRGVIPVEFESNAVAYDEGHSVQLEEKLLLKDAISDLPAVGNYDGRDEMPYDKPPETEFQRTIRLSKDELLGASSGSEKSEPILFDHRPLELNEDDYERVCQIPKRKGANFRDLRGVIVGADNKVAFDPEIERVYLKSGKPLVPDYAMSFINGTSSKPFGRLWWDETVPTVVTRAEPHNQVIIHPEQDRVLSIRENARLQGFPDYYKLCGPIKERYIQVGNAVAVPVARALGYCMAQALQGLAGDEAVVKLPSKFPNILDRHSSSSSEYDA